jgi:Fe2+ transport system protein FeoA
MFGFGKGFGKGRRGEGKKLRKRRHGFHLQPAMPLTHAQENRKYIVVSNLNRKTLEMGIYPNAILEVIKKGDKDSNMIIKIHDAQIIIPPNVAKEITVK